MSHTPVTSTPVTQSNSPAHLAQNHFTEIACADTPVSTTAVTDDYGLASATQEATSGTPSGVRRSGRTPQKKSLFFENQWPMSSKLNTSFTKSKSRAEASLSLHNDELSLSDVSCMADVSLMSQSTSNSKVELRNYDFKQC
jgi:hypothetical protein